MDVLGVSCLTERDILNQGRFVNCYPKLNISCPGVSFWDSIVISRLTSLFTCTNCVFSSHRENWTARDRYSISPFLFNRRVSKESCSMIRLIFMEIHHYCFSLPSPVCLYFTFGHDYSTVSTNPWNLKINFRATVNMKFTTSCWRFWDLCVTGVTCLFLHTQERVVVPRNQRKTPYLFALHFVWWRFLAECPLPFFPLSCHGNADFTELWGPL